MSSLIQIQKAYWRKKLTSLYSLSTKSPFALKMYHIDRLNTFALLIIIRPKTMDECTTYPIELHNILYESYGLRGHEREPSKYSEALLNEWPQNTLHSMKSSIWFGNFSSSSSSSFLNCTMTPVRPTRIIKS